MNAIHRQRTVGASPGLVPGVQGLVQQGNSLGQVDDVDAIALVENVFLHFRIPALGLMAEVNTCLEQLAHGNEWHGVTSISG